MADVTRGPDEQVWINGRRCDPEYVDHLVRVERERCASIVESLRRDDELICSDCAEAAARKIRSGK